MNLEESNSFVEKMEKNNRHKRTVIVILIICALLIVVLVGIMAYMSYLDSLTLKVFVDNKQVNFSNHFLVEENNGSYVNIKELSDMLGYSYQKGEYKNYTEDSNSCYLRTEYEIVSMVADENVVTKYLLNEMEIEEEEENSNSRDEKRTNSELIVVDEATGTKSFNIVVNSKNETQETIYIDEPIKYIDNELYVSFNEVSKLFNIGFNTNEENRVRIYSFDSLILSASQYAESVGYREVSNIYENLTAIASNMIVVGDGTNYGVVDAGTGKELISLKYEKIVYMQNTDEFLVTAEGSVGIVSKNGETIIKPTEYEKISVLDEINKLYLVEKDEKYGVLNGDGDIVVYCEYDSIGVEDSEEFQKENIRNFYLLFDELIPVNVNGKTGLIDMEGNEIFKPVYTLGYIANSEEEDEQTDISNSVSRPNSNTTNSTRNNNLTNTSNISNRTEDNSIATKLDEHDNVLTIAEETGIKGIVVRNYQNLYGIYDVKNRRLIPCSFTKIYSRTKSGVTTYYLEYNEQEIELSAYLKENGFLENYNTNPSNLENEIENNLE